MGKTTFYDGCIKNRERIWTVPCLNRNWLCFIDLISVRICNGMMCFDFIISIGKYWRSFTSYVRIPAFIISRAFYSLSLEIIMNEVQLMFIIPTVRDEIVLLLWLDSIRFSTTMHIN